MSDYGSIQVDAEWGWAALPHPESLPTALEVHVLPIADIGPHGFDARCFCGPRPLIDEDGFTRWCHNAFDGREAYELGLRRPH